MTKLYIDHAKLLDLQEKAIEEARTILKAKGITYPVFSSAIPDDENYGRLLAYAEQEAALIVQILRRPQGGERPLVVDNVKPKKQYGNSWYD